MKGVKEFCHFLYQFDLFSKNPDLYFKGQNKKSSKLGVVLTIFYIIVYIAFFIYKLIRMIKRKDIIFYDSYAYKDFPEMKLTNEEFYGAFSIGGIINESFYYATAEFISTFKVNRNWENITQKLNVEPCKLEKFGSKYIDLFKEEPLNKYYCLENIDFTLEGFDNLERYSYLSIKLFPCVNTTKDGIPCMPKEYVYKFLKKNKLEFKIEDNLIIPEVYETPREPQRKDINAAVFLDMYQKIYAYLQIVFIETDDDITGLNFLAKNRLEKYQKLESSKVIALPADDQILNKTNEPVCDITLQLDQKVLTTKRKYTTLLEVLGDVGGLMEIMWHVLNLFTSFITEMLYERSIVNNLFSFNIKKSLVLLKNKVCITRAITFKDSKLDETFKKSKQDDTIKKIDSICDLKKNNIEVFSKDSKEALYPRIQPLKLKDKKKSKKKKKRADKSQEKKKHKEKVSPSKVIITKNDIEESQNMGRNHHNNLNGDFAKKTESKENDKRSEKINFQNLKIKKVAVYCHCCCTSKKTKVQKYLFEEGKKILAEKLDIVNLFNKLLIVEKMQNNFNIEGKFIEMSEECKQNIDNIKKEISDYNMKAY